MSERAEYEVQRLRLELREVRAQLAREATVNTPEMVTLAVELPPETYARLCRHAEAHGLPPEAMVSLWMWRAVREF